MFSWMWKEKEYIKYVVLCGLEHVEQMLKDLIEETGKVDLEPKPASLSWTSTYASEDKSDMIFGHLKRLLRGR